MTQRLVSICPSNTELLHLLGLMDRVVGVDDYSDWPPELVAGLPKLGPDLNIDMEKLQALQPDLVIASLSVPGMEKNIERLEQLGLNYLVLDPKSFEDIYRDVETLGQACGVQERAAEIVAELRGRVERVVNAVPKGSEALNLYWEWWPRPLISPGSLNWLTELSRLVGAENLFADKPGDSYTAEHDEVISRAPDYVFAVWCGVHADKVKPSMITERPGWDAVPAVREGRVYVLEEGLYCRPSQRLFDGLEELARLLYPELQL
ncbi:ABC transporter substrate-binding protein [Tumebacillus flagellatus]|uniref:ABC transporter substrate-binding protein n=1 Tax=Tumebacillus flagellatus TaxID=1157490 RepID=A0A074MHD2_9BACL|nr:cobalamin-binding protein [Tumebacillus flagellatus]KEO85082.1 ABC transporter substrate-binding protein [Tumebacillus flagellatus]